MEVVGLAASVAPLVSLCLEFLERGRDFKGYKASSLQLNARFELAKSRLKQWARVVGIVDGKLFDPHHPLLDQPEVGRAVGIVLNCLLNNFGGSTEDAEVIVAQRHRQAENVPSGWRSIQRTNTDSKKAKSGTSSKNAFFWATGQKTEFTEQVEIFEILVERLYAVVPLDNTERSLQSAAEALEQVKLTQEEMFALVKWMQRDSLLEKMRSTDEWLDVLAVDQDFEEHINARLQGTCEWFFKNDAYLAWESDEFPGDTAKLFRFCAPPGHGKTVLTARLTQHMTDIKTTPVAHFFSSANVQSGTTPPHAIVRSWISQLTRVDNYVFELVYSQRAASKTLRATQAETWKLFRDIILAVSGCTFVLDGYDEFARSGDTRKDFLHQLKEQIARTRTRVLISSRPEDDIEAELPFPSTVLGLSLEGHRITGKDLKADIALYSKSAVSEQLPRKNESFQQELADQMVSKCDGMFLWIKLQKLELRDGKSKKQLRETVDKMPETLMQSYSRTWDDIVARSDYDRQRAIEILRWTCFAVSPLTVEQLTEALVHEFDADDSCEDDMPDDIDDNYIDGEIKGLCGSMIEIQKASNNDGKEKPGARLVRLVHISAKDFLVTKLPIPMPVSVKSPDASEHALHHMHIAEVCLRYVNCDVTWRSVPIDSDHDQTRFKQGLMKYAATRWWTHWKEAKMMSDEYKRLSLQLFSLDSAHFGKWSQNDWFYRDAWTERKNETGLNSRLYLAVLYELPHVLDYLHACGKLDFSSTTFSLGTPLATAVYKTGPFFDKLVSWGAEVNVKGGRDGSVLGGAVLACNLERARALLEGGADLKIRDWQGKPILTLACWKDDVKMMQLLLDYKADPSECKEANNSPLIRCISRKYLDGVKLLLDHGADFAIADESGIPPLHHACFYDNVEVVRLLLDRGADILQRGRWGRTALHEAAYAAQGGVTRLLLEREPNFLTLAGESEDYLYPIHCAAAAGSVEAVKVMLEYGENILHASRYGATPLHFACSEMDSTELVNFLLDNGADVVCRDHPQWTPLHNAAADGLPEVAKILLDRGADIHAKTEQDDDYLQPVHLAAESGSIKTLQLLLDYGADINIATIESWETPLHYACYKANLEMINFVIEKGADLLAKTHEGYTPWHVACRYGNTDVVTFFLERAGDVSSTADHGWTPLHLACQGSNVQVVKLLLEKRAGLLQTKDEDGWTPLHAACEYGSKDVITFLIEKGADVLEPEYERQRTPLQLACLNDKGDVVELVKLLLEKGSDVTQQTIDGSTAMHFACSNKSEEASQVVKLLLDRGADPTQMSKAGMAPMHRAVESGNLDTVRALLDAGAQLPGHTGPAANCFGLMHYAARSANREMVQFLVERDVAVDQVGRLNTTPLQVAIDRDDEEMIEALIDAGADVVTPLWHGDTMMELVEHVCSQHEKLQQWQSKVKFQVSPQCRETWLRRQISNLAHDALLVEQYSYREHWSLFTWLADALWRLGAKADFLFASRQTRCTRDVNGDVIHDRVCDNCDKDPIIGERWVCFTCPVSPAWSGIDFCGSCKAQLPDVENTEVQECFKHDLVQVPCCEIEDIEHEDERAKDPEVREWLETVATRYKVEGPMPPLVPITETT